MGSSMPADLSPAEQGAWARLVAYHIAPEPDATLAALAEKGQDLVSIDRDVRERHPGPLVAAACGRTTKRIPASGPGSGRRPRTTAT